MIRSICLLLAHVPDVCWSELQETHRILKSNIYIEAPRAVNLSLTFAGTFVLRVRWMNTGARTPTRTHEPVPS